MELLYLLSCGITLAMLVLLASRKSTAPQKAWLMAWLGVIAINLFGFYVQQVSPYHYFLELSSAAVFLHGPLLWGYFQKLVQRSSKPLLWPHFIPFALNLIILLPALLEGRLAHFTDTQRNLLMVAKLISLLSYTLVTLVHLHLFQRLLPNYFSGLENRKLQWLRFILYGMLAVWLVGAFNQVAFQLGAGLSAANEDLLLNIAVSLFVLALGYFGWRQGRIFLEKEEHALIDVVVEQENKTQKAPALVQGSDTQRLLQYMETEKPYLDPELTLPQLAAQVQLSTNELSARINKEIGLNFFDFVNSYRVAEVKRLLQNGEHHRQTLLGIALDAGFNSKASFNRVFKKQTGQTPTEYLGSLPASAVKEVS